MKSEVLELYDQSRDRVIPLELHENKEDRNAPVILINHGYGVKNTEYSFFAKGLSKAGYTVVSIQHDLENDEPLPKTGDLFKRRKPFWEKGVQNILFVISELKRINPALSLKKVILIGHSNGGDISMMFAERHPEMVEKIVSLDSLRYPFPTTEHIPILSLRANDTRADAGVIPNSGAVIVNMPNAKHIDFSDKGPLTVKEQALALIIQFLEGKS